MDLTWLALKIFGLKLDINQHNPQLIIFKVTNSKSNFTMIETKYVIKKFIAFEHST